ncbi:DUF2613 family protein [Mycobacterium sp.]|uniref:DUF2613 family protein n=1 Tax=Mycobacterium sp. TaxID=1785 RepID=UPI002BD170BD|nr:DUF2613 family protein [Mycobacterium sp.]HTQ20790.1 DUF2613 family protein [Mycobacterium sp.]
MSGFSLAALASLAVGLSIGAAATVGVTLAAEDQMPARSVPAPAAPHPLQYGDRCYRGYCVPCTNPKECLNKLPPGIRP